MYASQLVGKTALRTRPVYYGNGNVDYSYGSGKPVLIKSFTGSLIGIISSPFPDEHFLDARWNDDAWIEVPAPVAPAPTKAEKRLALFKKNLGDIKRAMNELTQAVEEIAKQ